MAALSLCLRRCGGMIAIARDFDRLPLLRSGTDIVVMVVRAILGEAVKRAVAVTHGDLGQQCMQQLCEYLFDERNKKEGFEGG